MDWRHWGRGRLFQRSCVASSNFDAPTSAGIAPAISAATGKMAQSSSSVVVTSRSKSEDIASSWAKSKARSASWRGETSNRSGDRRKRKTLAAYVVPQGEAFALPIIGTRTAAGVAHACGNVALLRHLARDLRRTGSRFPSASPAKTEAGHTAGADPLP